ncbi:MAG: carbohydrate kinase family protein [Bryobacteraceae bacterium]
MNILVAGELNPDLVLSDYTEFPSAGKEVLAKDLALTLGSASAICAVGLARLGNPVSFVSRLGKDVWGDFCLNALTTAGVETGSVVSDASLKTGMTVSITNSRDRALVTYVGAIATLRSEDIADDLLRQHTHLHVSSFYLQEQLRPGCLDLFERAHGFGLTSSLDPGFDPSEEWKDDIVRVLQAVDVFLPNEIELAKIGGSTDPATAIGNLQNGRTLIIAKLGREGCMTIHEGQVVRVPSYPITVVDTTGAGDSFNAGFLHAWLRKQGVEKAVRFASVCGALSTRDIGGTTSQATAAEVEDHLRSGSFAHA